MATEHALEEPGKVRRKPPATKADPHKDEGSNTTAEGSEIQHLQRTAGNAAVQRMLAQRTAAGPSELDEETSQAIQRQRGSGHELDSDVAQNAGEALGQDFEGVRVHTDGQSDQINRQIGARAFTTGSDIFFREGEYNPHSQGGQKLIHHELTHVVQQKAIPGATTDGPLQVNDPHDSHEAEADKVANHLSSEGVQRAAVEEEEEVMTKPAAEEEEEVMTKLQRQEEDEEVMTKLQRQEPEEEDEVKSN